MLVYGHVCSQRTVGIFAFLYSAALNNILAEDFRNLLSVLDRCRSVRRIDRGLLTELVTDL